MGGDSSVGVFLKDLGPYSKGFGENHGPLNRGVNLASVFRPETLGYCRADIFG